MDTEQIRSVLTSEIKTIPPADLDGNELASVLIIIYGESPFVIMTKKAKTLKVHAGEISFPGGNGVKKIKIYWKLQFVKQKRNYV